MATDNTLQSIELILPSFSSAGGEDLGRETRCFSGAPYLLRYKLTPEDYLLRGRDDIRVYVDVTEGLDLIDSCTIKELQAYSSGIDNRVTPEVVFKNDVTGTVKLKMCVEDLESGNTVSSNILELDVQPRHGTISDEDVFWDQYSSVGPTVNTDSIILRVGETFDCINRISLNKHSRYPNLHRGISRYFYVIPVSYLPKEGDWKPEGYTTGTINSASYIGTKTDGTTLIAKATGCGKVDIRYLVQTSSGSYSTSRETIPFTVIDDAEALADTMNLRFRIPEIVIDRSYPLFYSGSSRDRDILQGTNYTWPYENEDGERDKRLQLYDKYGSTNYEDFLEYDDPNGYFDSSRLSLRFENSDGEYLINSDKKDSGVLCAWEEGTIYLVARYGILSSTQQRTKISIPFTMETRNPNFIPIRYTFAGLQTPRADEMDFSAWHPATEVLDIVPLDATINVSNFSMTEGIGDLLFTERIGTSGTLNEQYRVRISGIGQANVSYFCSYKNGGTFYGEGGIFKIGLPYWDGYRYIEACAPSSRAFVPSKSEIKKGEYVFIELQNNPDEEYTLNSTIIADKYVRYSVNSGELMSASRLTATGIAEVICESRRGVILKGLAPGTINLVYGGRADGENGTATTTITILDSQYSTPTGNLKINASKNTDGTVKSGQTLTLTGGTAAGWNSSSWRYASVKKSGYLQTFTSGTVTIYAVTADGRLTSATYTTQAAGSSTPVTPEPDVPVDTTLKEAEDTSDDLILSFDRTTPVEFDSPESAPITVDVIKGSHNFYLTDVTCISENPGVATAQASFNISNGDMDVTITPKGKGSTVVRIVCGGAEDSVDVNVFGGSNATTPKLEYDGQYGVSLNVYEYTEISFKASSSSVYQALEYSVSQGREDKITVEGGNYNSTTGVATIRVALKDHISGYVYVTYGTERLIFSIANRFNLKFEDIHNFVLGVGATRYIKIYPLDNTIKASSINVYSERNNVIVSSVENGGIEPDTGKRFFLVEVKYRRAGQDMLIASREGDDDIYLDFTCEATSVPAQSINFNTNSITINK